jgi:hypothetical protein
MTYQQTFNPVTDTHGGTGYAVGYVKFEPNTQLVNELTALAQVYEQYNVSRCEVFATLGKGFDANNKFKLKIYSRVDPDDVIQYGTHLDYYFSVLTGQNTTLHTFNERGRVKLADFRPKFFSYGDDQANTPILPSQLQWYPLDPSHFINQKFTGLMVAGNMPDESISPGSLGMTIDVSLTFKFRGRVIADTAFKTLSTFTSINRADPSDDTISADVKALKTNVMPGETGKTSKQNDREDEDPGHGDQELETTVNSDNATFPIK